VTGGRGWAVIVAMGIIVKAPARAVLSNVIRMVITF
jgi:hypothetical protein